MAISLSPFLACALLLLTSSTSTTNAFVVGGSPAAFARRTTSQTRSQLNMAEAASICPEVSLNARPGSEIALVACG